MKTYEFKVYFKKGGEPTYYYGQTFEKAVIVVTAERIRAGLDTGISKMVCENGVIVNDVNLPVNLNVVSLG